MIQMVSLRTFRLATTSGHILQFTAKVPRDVPNVIVADAMAAGCMPTDETEAPFFDDLRASRAEFTGDIRRSVLLLAMRALAEENNTKHFTGGGTPRSDVVNDRLGFDVTSKEITGIWREYLTAKNTGADLVLHDDADKIMAVINAEDRDSLRGLAVSCGVPPEKLEGLTTRDARKLLLTKFHGLTS